MKKILALAVFLAAIALGRPADALIIIDTQTFSGAQCGADCFGATYTLVVTDDDDANASTFAATLTVAIGTYTGSMTHIGAVDIKPGQVTSGSLTDFSIGGVSQGGGPTGTGGWTTSFTGGQAAGNCLQGSGGFLCSRDTGTNSLAPTTNNTTYAWSWDFTLSGAYEFGHLGVNYTVADDSKNGKADELQDGQNISIGEAGETDGASPTDIIGKVPEPSTLLLLGAGLIAIVGVARRRK